MGVIGGFFLGGIIKDAALTLIYSVVGRGLHSFPFQLNLSSSVHRITQLDS